MPSFPHFPSANDSDDLFAMLHCDRCGAIVFRVRPSGPRRFMLCDRCYTEWHEPTTRETIRAGSVVDERPECNPEPEPGVTYCAAAYLAYLETSGMSFVPQGMAALCEAHWLAVLDDAVEQFPQLICQPWRVFHIGRHLANIYIRVAERIASRIGARLESR